MWEPYIAAGTATTINANAFANSLRATAAVANKNFFREASSSVNTW